MATMPGKGLLPMSGRIRQRQVGKGEGTGQGQGMGKGVLAVAPGVLRYRVRDGGGVPAVGEVHTASAAPSAMVRALVSEARIGSLSQLCLSSVSCFVPRRCHSGCGFGRLGWGGVLRTARPVCVW